MKVRQAITRREWEHVPEGERTLVVTGHSGMTTAWIVPAREYDGSPHRVCYAVTPAEWERWQRAYEEFEAARQAIQQAPRARFVEASE
jgi:hypothetical protein